MSEAWPDELYDADEWPDVMKKPDAMYLSGGTVFLNLFSDHPVRLGEFGETEIVPCKPNDQDGN